MMKTLFAAFVIWLGGALIIALATSALPVAAFAAAEAAWLVAMFVLVLRETKIKARERR